MMLAHVFGGDGGPAAGFVHPLVGLDHLTAMVSVGVISARIGGRAIWTVPGTFVGLMVMGGILGVMSVPFAGIELGVATSVLILGVALAATGNAPTWAALAAVAFFGLFHGFAHGAEMPAVASPMLYALGFAVSTIGLHLIGVLSGLLVLCRRQGAARLRGAGVVIALAGVWFVVAAIH